MNVTEFKYSVKIFLSRLCMFCFMLTLLGCDSTYNRYSYLYERNIFEGLLFELRLKDKLNESYPTRLTSVKRIFVTHSQYNGNLGGFLGADKKCNEDLNTPPSKTGFRALLYGNNATYKNINYYRIDGVFIAKAIDGNLNSGKLELTNPISKIKFSQHWTGSLDGQNCDNWNKNTRTYDTTIGATDETGERWWKNYVGLTCAHKLRLLCVEI